MPYNGRSHKHHFHCVAISARKKQRSETSRRRLLPGVITYASKYLHGHVLEFSRGGRGIDPAIRIMTLRRARDDDDTIARNDDDRRRCHRRCAPRRWCIISCVLSMSRASTRTTFRHRFNCLLSNGSHSPSHSLNSRAR